MTSSTDTKETGGGMVFVAILAVIVIANAAMLLMGKLPADETQPIAIVLAAPIVANIVLTITQPGP